MIEDYVPEAGDIVWTDFNPSTGREQGGRRPALVVSPREFYDGTRFLVVCPIERRSARWVADRRRNSRCANAND
jgi:mRNA interferase MazF